MDKFRELREKLASLEKDAQLFYAKGNKSAGTRLRKGLQDIKVLAQGCRLDVSSTKNS